MVKNNQPDHFPDFRYLIVVNAIMASTVFLQQEVGNYIQLVICIEIIVNVATHAVKECEIVYRKPPSV